jgi:DNA-nicking Smr family endonuclease
VNDGSDDDARAFKEAMRGARPLPPEDRQRRAALPPAPARGAPPRRPPRPTRALVGTLALTDAALTESTAFEVQVTGDSIAGRATGIDAKLLRRLKAGEFPVDARLDLHGRARDQALGALERFMNSAHQQEQRCVLLIHGRGHHSAEDGPVLKPMAWQWLTASTLASSVVMAFASARPAQGGDGATLVLLRRPGR